MTLSVSEAERMRKTIEYDREKWRRIAKTPEAKTQALMFKSWVALSSYEYAEVKGNLGMVWCPIHNRLEKVTLECGLTVDKAIEMLAEQIPEHSKEVKKAREKVEAEMGGEAPK